MGHGRVVAGRAGVSRMCRTASRSCTLGMASSRILLLAILCSFERHHVFQRCSMNTIKHRTFKENDTGGCS